MRWLLVGITVAIAGCSQPNQMQRKSAQSLQVSEMAPAPPGERIEATATPAAQISYSYTVAYRFDRRDVAAVQAKQVTLCRDAGPTRCQLIKSSLSNGDGETSTASETTLFVDARLASGFNDRLDAIATAVGATVANRQTTAEDLTKQIVDTDAHVRAKQALATRLLGIINNRAGKVGELVEAEKAYADTQEQLDAARGEQAALGQRIRMSRIDIAYSYDPGSAAAAPMRDSVRSAGEALSASIAALITFAVVASPWLLIAAGLLWLRRRMGWRWPLRTRPGVGHQPPSV